MPDFHIRTEHDEPIEVACSYHHRSGSRVVHVSFGGGGENDGEANLSTEEARALARAITDAADQIEVERAKSSSDQIEPVAGAYHNPNGEG